LPAIRHLFLLGTAIILLSPLPAGAAECTRMGFSVNDYGKEGPARDAQALLDKHIKAELDKKGIKAYKTGNKTVDCKLFLDFGFFDEYTCTAYAEVCWGDGPVTRRGALPVPEGGKKPSKRRAGAADKPIP
jgi:hypothetical protein